MIRRPRRSGGRGGAVGGGVAARPPALASVEKARWKRLRGVFATCFILFAALCLQPATGQTAGGAAEPAGVAVAVSAATPSVGPANAARDAEIRGLLMQLGQAEAASRKPILQALAKTGDQRLVATFKDFTDGSLYLWKEQAVLCTDVEKSADGQKIAPLCDPLTREPITEGGQQVRVPVESLKAISVTGRDRVQQRDALSLLKLSNADRDARLSAVIKSGEGAVAANLPALEELAKSETDPAIKTALRESIALIHLATEGDDGGSRKVRLEAAARLGEMRSVRALSTLQELRKKETEPAAQKTFDTAIHRIAQWQSTIAWIGNIFSGISLSSILILMALGLAIIFGLMGVINMAHGELMMIGAYATYISQETFTKYLPGHFNGFFIVAIPLSFVAAALIGMVMEGTIIRHLYGRPLDTLLATLGVSFILQQVVRINFGGNIHVNSPTWLQGSFEIMQDVRLPYNRLFIMTFCIGCVGLMYFILERTRLGLLLRATTQNRAMAASLGVSTRKIDMLTFGLGSGLAGMAGCALTQIGGVTPDMGQNYVIDSFLVVVVGGVGKLAGTIWSGLGMGSADKVLEAETGAVWAKILILVLVVAFIQRKPSGLFPAKGRTADV